jgi:glycosyltransferase involved in cell wall biosynthesis
MRIILASLDIAPCRSSGLAVYAELLARGLAEVGHEVTLVASHRGKAPRSVRRQNVRVVWIPQGVANWITFAYRAAVLLNELARSSSVDAVHFLDARFAYAYRGPYVATLFQSFRQQLTADGGLPYHSSFANLVWRYVYYSLAQKLLEQQGLKRAEALIAPSEAVKREFVHYYGVPKAKVAVVPLGIDTDRFRPQPVTALREQLGLTGKRILLYAGFSTPRKGLEYLSAILARASEDVRLLLIGRWERGYREKVYGIWGESAGRVIEMGYVPDEQMPFYYSLADLFVLPSLLEGFGLPLVEAMACGLPVVATSVGSIPEVVANVGLLVPARSSEALADAVFSLLADRARRQEYAEQGRAQVLARFDYAYMVNGTLAVYQ